jgi:hypothetical protein
MIAKTEIIRQPKTVENIRAELHLKNIARVAKSIQYISKLVKKK